MSPELIITKSNKAAANIWWFSAVPPSLLPYTCLAPKGSETMYSQELGEMRDMTRSDLLPTEDTSRRYSLLHKMDITQKSLNILIHLINICHFKNGRVELMSPDQEPLGLTLVKT